LADAVNLEAFDERSPEPPPCAGKASSSCASGYGAELPEAMMAVVIDGLLEILAKVTADERALAN
jgi:hypothetical protein